MQRARVAAAWRVGLALGVCAALGCHAGRASEPLRIMTFNVRYGTADDGADRWELRRGLLIETIRRAAPDLLGTQEGLRFQLDELQGALPELAWVGVGRDDGRNAGEFAALFYRRARLTVSESGTFWLSDTPEVPGSNSWGNEITRICTWARLRDLTNGRRVLACNLHLDHVSQPSRERGLALVLERARRLAASDPLVIMGDFNMDEPNPTWGTMRRAGLVDTLRALHPGAREVGTYHDFSGRTDGERIDYIWVSRGLLPLAAAIDRTRDGTRCPSDHDAVTAAVSFANSSP